MRMLTKSYYFLFAGDLKPANEAFFRELTSKTIALKREFLVLPTIVFNSGLLVLYYSPGSLE